MISKVATAAYGNFAKIIFFKLNMFVIKLNVDGCMALDTLRLSIFPD